MKQRPWFVYMIETSASQLYTGISMDVEKRFEKHASGKGAKFFRMDPPRKIVFVDQCGKKGKALAREHQIKKMSPAEKRTLILQSTKSDQT